jgi:hypothetical protein
VCELKILGLLTSKASLFLESIIIILLLLRKWGKTEKPSSSSRRSIEKIRWKQKFSSMETIMIYDAINGSTWCQDMTCVC